MCHGNLYSPVKPTDLQRQHDAVVDRRHGDVSGGERQELVATDPGRDRQLRQRHVVSAQLRAADRAYEHAFDHLTAQAHLAA